jgi:hypothetical protein
MVESSFDHQVFISDVDDLQGRGAGYDISIHALKYALATLIQTKSSIPSPL